MGCKVKIAALVLAGLGIAGVAAVAAGYWPWSQESLPPVFVHTPVADEDSEPQDGPEVLPVPQRVEASKKLEGPGHVEPPKILEGALARLHYEAVTKFINAD